MAFDPRTGHPKPLDDAYVAEELREWGQSPLGWETFVEDSGDDSLWQRSGFRVLPEAGCAADEVAVAPFSWGVDLASCRVVASSHGILAADSPRRPSGECGQAVAQPFVDVRTIFGPSDLGDRIRVDVKVDAASCSIISCVVCAERRDAATEPPFSSPPRPGSSRAKGLDSSSVSSRCGPCFVSSKDGTATFDEDGATKLELVDGLIHVWLAPRVNGGADVGVVLGGRGLRRSIAADGDVVDVGRIS